MSDHDPFNEPEHAHARARELMSEDVLWHCADEEAPFGSDEGHDAYYEFRDCRERNPHGALTDCLSWIMDGRLTEYDETLCADARVQRDIAEPSEAFLAEHYDPFTLDATVIATGLGQLLDEGRIDADAKPYIDVAIKRQLHPAMLTSDNRKQILLAIARVVDQA